MGSFRERDQLELRDLKTKRGVGGDKEGTVSAKAPRASTTLSRTRNTIANKGKGSKRKV